LRFVSNFLGECQRIHGDTHARTHGGIVARGQCASGLELEYGHWVWVGIWRARKSAAAWPLHDIIKVIKLHGQSREDKLWGHTAAGIKCGTLSMILRMLSMAQVWSLWSSIVGIGANHSTRLLPMCAYDQLKLFIEELFRAKWRTSQ
jgi:hypothetical protein